MSEMDEFLSKLGSELKPVDPVGSQNVGKDLQLIAKELTDDRNVYRFTNIKKREVPSMAFRLATADAYNYYKLPELQKKWVSPRMYWYYLFNFYENTLNAAVKGQMVEIYRDQSGYLLAFRGGIEWRQAGIASDGMMMEEQKMSMMQRMKR